MSVYAYQDVDLIRTRSSRLIIPACLGHLSALRNLSLPFLNLEGPIPSSFSRLLHLQHLALSGNSLSGALQPISSLVHLQHLDLSWNSQLSGALLPIFSSLPNLTYLDLYLCNISGPLAPFRAPLLQHLALSALPSIFNGSTLVDFLLPSNLPSLTEVYLFANAISGSIPPSIAQFSHLVALDLSENNLSGELDPRLFCKLVSLRYLDLSFNLALNGTQLDSWECMFKNLTTLSLQGMALTGPFPRWIGRSPSLQNLDLSRNKFRGPLPDHEWQHLHNLRRLDLSGNSLSPSHLRHAHARLPDWIFRLPLQSFVAESCDLQTHDVLCGGKLSLLNQSLQELYLNDNYLTGRDTLECFALHNFSQAVSLDLSGNPLYINLSDVLLPPLVGRYLDLRSCGLHGYVPQSGWRVLAPDVAFVNFANNSLIGSLPVPILNSSSFFIRLNLSHNLFTGVDPLLINISSRSLRFAVLDLSHNALAMHLSSLLASLGLIHCNHSWYTSYDHDYFPALEFNLGIDLSHNALVGEIPSSLATCNVKPRLFTRIKIDNNNLVGSIPNELSGLASLQTLKLNNNSLRGTIPPSIIAMSSLTLLDLSHNELEGNLDTLFSFHTPTPLRVLLLSYNHISGSLPPSFGSCMPNLQLIDFSNNRLTGIIPQSLKLPYFKNLEATVVTNSTSTGDLYEEVDVVEKGNVRQYTYVLNVMTSLDLSCNSLEGAIPKEVGDLAGLIFLNLSHNNLSGSVPSTLAKLSQLEQLDLSCNQLKGPLPPQLSNLTKLSVFNVSFNVRLRGSIPQGPQFESNESYKGDLQLCGYPTLQACNLGTTSAAVPQYTAIIQPTTNNVAHWIDEWISICGLSLGLLIGFVTTLLLLHYKDIKPFISNLCKKAR